jgi:Phosphoribosyl transferase/TRSP domain C terminus to PRTase_2
MNGTSHSSSDHSTDHVVQLPSGQLRLRLEQSRLGLEDMLEFGVRENPKRGFLLISKWLGKHLPVRPSAMLQTYRWLASSIPADLPGPITCIAMAETATALGQGVLEAFCELTQRKALFLHSTRYRFADYETLTFEETHSHASTHHLHIPKDAAQLDHWFSTRSLVLIDDEISTGKTLLALANAFKTQIPTLERIVLVSLTDFLGERRQGVQQNFPVPTQSVALAYGGFKFTPALDWQVTTPNVTGGDTHRAPKRGGRIGCWANGWQPDVIKRALESIRVAPGERLRVLGSGEFQFEPFLLALALEQAGANVTFHASTRSPVLPFGVIKSRLEFVDNYGQGIHNYLYNMADVNERMLLCLETPPDNWQPGDLSAQKVFL